MQQVCTLGYHFAIKLFSPSVKRWYTLLLPFFIIIVLKIRKHNVTKKEASKKSFTNGSEY